MKSHPIKVFQGPLKQALRARCNISKTQTVVDREDSEVDLQLRSVSFNRLD